MKYGSLVLSVMIIFLCISGVSNATILHYSVTGTMLFRDTNWNNPYSTNIYGDMYISDTDAIRYYYDEYQGTHIIDEANYTITSFAMNAGEYGWGGTGRILMTHADIYYYLHGVGDFGSDWFTGEEASGSWYDWQLPETINFPGFAWYFGDEFYSRVQTLVATYTPSAPVPEPSTIVLMGLGLVGLAGFGRKKFKK